MNLLWRNFLNHDSSILPVRNIWYITYRKVKRENMQDDWTEEFYNEINPEKGMRY